MAMFAFIAESLVFGILVAAFLCMLLLLSTIMATVFMVVRWKERKNGQQWSEAARQLALNLEAINGMAFRGTEPNVVTGTAAPATSQKMFGEFAGRPVEVHISQVWKSHFPIYDRSRMVQKKKYFTICIAKIEVNARVTFSVQSTKQMGIVTRALSQSGTPIGYPPFDQHFESSSNDANELIRIFQTRAGDGKTAAERFVGRLGAFASIRATENEVRVEYSGMILNAPQIGAGLKAASELAARIEYASTNNVWS